MATNKNFEVKNGLTVAGTERISSAGAFTGSLTGSLASATTATTQSASDNSTKIATTAYTDAAITALVDSSPGALNTLNELAAALGDDASFSTTVTNSIATKLPLAGGTLTGALDVNGNIDAGIGAANSNNYQIRVSAGTSGLSRFIAADTSDAGYIDYEHSSNSWIHRTAGTERIRITNAGNLHLNTGVDARVQLGTSGTGASSLSDNTVYIRGNDDNLILGAAGNGNISFKENADTRMFIKAGGNVGIGTTNPSYKLTINTADEDHIRLENGSEVGFIRLLDTGILDFWAHGSDEITFTNGSGSGTERMRINSSGQLHVTGSSDGNLTSAIFANTATGGTNDRVGIEFQLAGTSGQVAAGTIRAGKSEDWSSGTSRSGFLSLEAVLDGTNREMMYLGSDGDGSSIVRFSTANIERMRLEANGILALGNDSNRRPFAVQSSMGYASSYKATVIGSASTNYNTGVTGATSLCFNYDPSGNSNGSFGGNGGEIWFRRSTAIKTPNSADNAFFTQFSMTDGVTSGDFNDTSDRNLKENITSITNGYDVIKDLNPVTFNWKDSGKGNGLGGFIAQEVETVLPNDVFGEDYAEGDRGQPLTDGKSINTTSIVAHLVKAVQELEARIKELEG